MFVIILVVLFLASNAFLLWIWRELGRQIEVESILENPPVWHGDWYDDELEQTSLGQDTHGKTSLDQ